MPEADFTLQDVVTRSQEVPQYAKQQDSNWKQQIQDEMDGYFEEMKRFPIMPLEEVYYRLSAWTARATEIKVQLSRSKTVNSRFCSSEIEPFISECDRQFKYYSRMQTSQELEWRFAGKT